MNARTASVTAARSEVSSGRTPAKPASSRPPSTSPIDTSALSGVPQPPAANPSGTLRAIASSFDERPGWPAARAAALPPASGGSNATSRQTLSGSATTAADAGPAPALETGRDAVRAVLDPDHDARQPDVETGGDRSNEPPGPADERHADVRPAGVELVAVVDGVEDHRQDARARSATRRPSRRAKASIASRPTAVAADAVEPRGDWRRRGPSHPRASRAGPGRRPAPRSPRRPGRGVASPPSTATPRPRPRSRRPPPTNDVVCRHRVGAHREVVLARSPRRSRAAASGWTQVPPSSTSTSVPGSVDVHVRPPSRSRASSTVTRCPAAARSLAATSPASPPPRTTTSTSDVRPPGRRLP